MFARDFWRTGRWHKLTTGDPGSPLYFTEQPYIAELQETYVLVRFGANTGCQAYMEWATSAAALGGATDSTNAPGETSFTYSDHTQTATGLTRTTTYYLRVVITDADSNTLTSNVHAWPHFNRARKAGATLVVIDPYRNRTAQRADVHLMIKPGTDAALALAVMQVLIDRDMIDRDFIAHSTTGFEELKVRAAEYTPARAADICGLSEEMIIRLAEGYGRARAP